MVRQDDIDEYLEIDKTGIYKEILEKKLKLAIQMD
jgi:hypothetical protein